MNIHPVYFVDRCELRWLKEWRTWKMVYDWGLKCEKGPPRSYMNASWALVSPYRYDK